MGKIFKRGLIAVAPVALTLVLLLWLFNTLEALFRPVVEGIVGPDYYFQGLGILVALVLIFFVGVGINNWLIQKCSKLVDSFLVKIPFVKTLYNSIGEMMTCFQGGGEQKAGQVVQVEIDGLKFLGLVTRDSLLDAPEGMSEEGEVAVFLPMSYQIGGYTVILPRSRVKKLPMTVEEGMRFAVTAGVLSHGKKQNPTQIQP